ncbi:MAG: hypothetical protein ACYDAJ_00090 [Nitrosotalea sp.]
MAEASFAIFGLTIIIAWILSLYIFTVRSFRKKRESTNIVLHEKRNFRIGIISGGLLSTLSSLGTIFSTFGTKLPWPAIIIIALSYVFVVSLVSIDLVIFQIGFRIKKLPVNNDMKSFYDGMLIPFTTLLLLNLLLRIDPTVLKNCCV